MEEKRYVYHKVYKDYGRIVLTIDYMLKKRKMNIYKLSKLTGINWSIVQKYVSGNLYRVDLDLLSRMCFALNCSLEDLAHYEKKNQITSSKKEEHPISVHKD